MKVQKAVSCLTALALACGFAGSASASLTSFQTYNGHVGYSSDGFGSTTQDGTIKASVPVGSTVLAAFLYTATYDSYPTVGDGTTFNGNAVTWSSYSLNSDACCDIASRRADVTSIVKPVIDGGAGGVYTFRLSESADNQDGESLVVVYSNPLLPTATFGILDGFARTTGDTAMINFADPLDPTQAGFFAEMFLGIGFSFDGSGCTGGDQTSTVKVNGTTITNNAGCNDDSIDALAENGNLITTGGFNDPFSPSLPSLQDDHERYNLASYVTLGDTSIRIDTFNTSANDNIFLAGFYVLGTAGINVPPTGVPEPSEFGLFGAGLLGLWFLKRRRDRAVRNA